jgi:hypothetical protein
MNPQEPNTQEPQAPVTLPQPEVTPPVTQLPQLQSYSTMQSNTSQNPNRFRILLLVTGLILIIIVGGGFIILRKDKKQESPAINDQSSSEVATTSPTPTTTTIIIDKTLTDETGLNIKATKLVRNFMPEKVSKYKEVALVELTFSSTTASSTITSTVCASPAYLQLVVDGNANKMADKSLITDDDLTAAGLTPFSPRGAVHFGKTGVVPFEIPANANSIVLRCAQPESKISGGREMSAKNFDVTLIP